jgi:MFS family permease
LKREVVLLERWELQCTFFQSYMQNITKSTSVMGPVLGPVCGGWMSERASWRWTCWVPVSSPLS